MSSLQDLPEHVQHDILFMTINSTESVGWQLSLRLVDHAFNEALLHVFYLRKRRLPQYDYHAMDCVQPCWSYFCTRLTSARRTTNYSTRFYLQTLLATRHFNNNNHLVQEWQAAVDILRAILELDSSQARFYSTCSNNPIFNNIPTAILADAIASFSHVSHPLSLLPGASHHSYRYKSSQSAFPPEFWVALSASVLGDLPLLQTYLDRMTLAAEKSSGGLSHRPVGAHYLTAILETAINYGKPSIINYVRHEYPEVLSGTNANCFPLRAAIFSQNVTVLKTVLECTTTSSEMLVRALLQRDRMLTRSCDASEIIRLLARHFTPLSAGARQWLILHSCSVGDVTLLEEFSRTESLFSQRFDDLDGRLPTYVYRVIRSGNADNLRFLLDHGVVVGQNWDVVHKLMRQTLSFNQMECYRVLYSHFKAARSDMAMLYLPWADNSEDLMTSIIDEDRSYFFDPQTQSKDSKYSTIQWCLWFAINRLRPGNIEYFLRMGVQLIPPPQTHSFDDTPNDPFDIPWPYYHMNQDAFIRTQAVLGAWNLPSLRIVV